MACHHRVVFAVALLAIAARGFRTPAPRPFRYELCEPSRAYPVAIEQLSLEPYPLVFGGQATLNAALRLGETLSRVPVHLELQKQREIGGGWATVPCVDGVGSCNYEDICTELAKTKNCPEQITRQGSDCHCPIRAGNYTTGGPLAVTLPSVNAVLASQLTGNFRVKAKVLDQNSNEALCVVLYVSLKGK
eukprot:m51a1_g4774 putative ganglioside gm2 activator (190) ;mRNA; f:28030-28679